LEEQVREAGVYGVYWVQLCQCVHTLSVGRGCGVCTGVFCGRVRVVCVCGCRCVACGVCVWVVCGLCVDGLSGLSIERTVGVLCV
jgi:hypothetical protein